jgi:hypothetical protein
MKPIKKRFLDIIEENKVKTVDLAKEMNVAASSVSITMNSGDTISKVEYYEALHSLTSCNLNWVITGQGEKYLVAVTKDNELLHVAEPKENYNNFGKLLQEFEKNYQNAIDEKDEYKRMLEKAIEALKK